MRITRDTLLKIVRDTVTQRTRSDRGILAIFMHGSLLEDEYLLGNTTDLDLFIIHTDAVPVQREIVHLTDDIHIDISHYLNRDFRNTRMLRVHPWIGPTLKDARILFDPQHFLDFTQASVRGQYDEPDHVIERSRKQVASARQIWQSLHELHSDPSPKDILSYLRALENAANSIVGVSGSPLTERRFLVRLPQRLEAAGRPGLYPGLLGMLGAQYVDGETLKSWLPLWQSAYREVAATTTIEQIPARIHPLRESYYSHAFEALMGGSQPLTALWPLLRSWTLAITTLVQPGEHRANWQTGLERLNLAGASFRERVAGLDAYLDMVEETLDQWAVANGASET